MRPLIRTSSSACNSPLKCSVGPKIETRSDALSYGLDIVETPPRTETPRNGTRHWCDRGYRQAPVSLPGAVEHDATRVTQRGAPATLQFLRAPIRVRI